MLYNRSLKIFRDSKLKTAPTDTPITVAEAKAQLNIDASFSTDDTYIGTLIYAATEWLQNQIQVQLMQAQWYLVLNAWDYDRDYVLELPWSPLVAVGSVEYYNESNVLTAWNSANYQTYNYSQPGKIRFVESLPSLYDRLDAVIITYTAGYGASGANAAAQQAAVPYLVKQILKILVTEFYDQRGHEYKPSDRVKELMSTLKVFLKC